MINGLGLGCRDHCLLKNNKKKLEKKNQQKNFFLIFWNFNPGWLRDHPGLYGFLMYGDQKNNKKMEKKFTDFFWLFLIYSGQNDQG